MEKIRILIAEDHKLIRETWTFILNNDGRFAVVAACSDSAEAVDLAEKERPDVILMDINMMPMNGFEATARFGEVTPESKVIGLSFYSEMLFVKKMFSAGAKGYITKNSGREEMYEAILAVQAGQLFVCEEIRNKGIDLDTQPDADPAYIESLTNKEIQISQCIRQGLRSKDIADLLSISIKTVEVHRHNILRKMHVKNSISLVNLMNSKNGYVRYSF
ncbi:MAG TPA: response regulator transcription factor [Puia sp.]|jgi:DNA-binding NarL/FixJ family response regulator